tara:strand:- start:332 stop:832 length:501 start_codon:yes stop_codon:yes gene_type:complete
MKKIFYKDIECIFFDFDGVLTDNYVYLDSNNRELVRCSRSDGLAFNAMRKIGIESFIISSEKNSVVKARANKLKVKYFNNVKDKKNKIMHIVNKYKYDIKKCIFVGNDLNDYSAMELCGLSMCPADSHKKILNLSTIVLSKNGGEGVAREIVEDVLKLDLLKILAN